MMHKLAKLMYTESQIKACEGQNWRAPTILLYAEELGKTEPSKGVRRTFGQQGVFVGLEFSILNL